MWIPFLIPAIAGVHKIDIFQDYYGMPTYNISVHFLPTTAAGAEMIKIRDRNDWIPCHLPKVQGLEASSTVDREDVLLRKALTIIRTLPCLKYSGQTWEYTFCYNKTIIQNVSPDFIATAEDLDTSTISVLEKLEYTLGVFKAKVRDHRYDDLNEAGSYLLQRYDGSFAVKQLWNQGDYCKIVGHPREVEVQYYCGDNDELEVLTEYSVCLYSARIKSKGLCTLEEFKPQIVHAQGQTQCEIDEDNDICREGPGPVLFGCGYCEGISDCVGPPPNSLQCRNSKLKSIFTAEQ